MTNLIQRMFSSDEGDRAEIPEVKEIEGLPESPQRYTGKITKVSPAGWGFISSKEIPFTRIFFHWTSLRQDTKHFTELQNQMVVEFNTVRHPEKGLRATKLRVIELKIEAK